MPMYRITLEPAEKGWRIFEAADDEAAKKWAASYAKDKPYYEGYELGEYRPICEHTNISAAVRRLAQGA